MPPTMNTYYRNYRGQMLLSKTGREYKQSIARSLSTISGRAFGDSRVQIEVRIHSKNMRKFDLDNRTKALFDSLQYARIIDDDEQIDFYSVRRMPYGAAAIGCVVIKIEELDINIDDGNEDW